MSSNLYIQTHARDTEILDSHRLVRSLACRLAPLSGPYIPGKTRIRDAIMDELDCSAEVAEGLVDTLENEGRLEYVAPRGRVERVPGHWRFAGNATSRRRNPRRNRRYSHLR